MVTFIEWVRGIELVRPFIESLLSESRRGEPVDFTDLAKRFVQAAQHIIKQSNLPDGVKTAALTIDKTPQLQPHVLGGKLRGALSKIPDGSTQEDMISDTFLRMVQKMPDILAKQYADSSNPPTAQQLGDYLGTLFQYDVSQFSVKQMWRKAAKAPKNLSDIQNDDGTEIEPGYEPADPYAAPSRPKMSRQRWNDAIKVVMGVQKSIHDDIDRINSDSRSRERTGKKQEHADKLNVTLALMRNMPMEVARQIGAEGDGMSMDDGKVYSRLKKMIKDGESDMDGGDRSLLMQWAGKDGGDDHEHRDIIAAAIWIANGMKESEKPQRVANVEGRNAWFLKYAEIPDEEEATQDEEPLQYTSPKNDKPDEPDEPDEPTDDYSGANLFATDNKDEPEPEPEPEPTPTRFSPNVERKRKKKKKNRDNPQQRSLFDDF
jgi:hypothetical protein